MNFDKDKLHHAREGFKLLAALCFNDFEPTPYQLDTVEEMFKTWAEQERLVADHLRRVA